MSRSQEICMCISVQINAFFCDFFLLRMNQSKESASQSAHKIQKLTSKVLRSIFVNSPFLLLLLSTMKLSLIMNVSVIFVVSILFLMSVHPGVEANTVRKKIGVLKNFFNRILSTHHMCYIIWCVCCSNETNLITF